MNKTVFCCFLVGVLLSALAVECSAQSHFVRFSLDEAYIGEYPPQGNRDILRSAGSSTSVGFGYRYSRRHFLLDVGLSTAYVYVDNAIADSVVSDWTNTESRTFFLATDTLFTHRYDKIQRWSMQLPVMAGFEWNRLYALAGIKLNTVLWCTQAEKGEKQVHITGMYSKDPVTWEMQPASDMGSHEVETVRQNYTWESNVPQVMVDLRLCAEIGCRLNLREFAHTYRTNSQRKDYYLAAFAEYGFPNLYNTPYSQWTVGIRFTALWEIRKTAKCMCYIN